MSRKPTYIAALLLAATLWAGEAPRPVGVVFARSDNGALIRVTRVNTPATTQPVAPPPASDVSEPVHAADLVISVGRPDGSWQEFGQLAEHAYSREGDWPITVMDAAYFGDRVYLLYASGGALRRVFVSRLAPNGGDGAVVMLPDVVNTWTIPARYESGHFINRLTNQPLTVIVYNVEPDEWEPKRFRVKDLFEPKPEGPAK